MRIICTTPCDVVVDGKRKALFEGQAYDLPKEAVEDAIEAGTVKAARGKAVSGPPTDKGQGSD